MSRTFHHSRRRAARVTPTRHLPPVVLEIQVYEDSERYTAGAPCSCDLCEQDPNRATPEGH